MTLTCRTPLRLLGVAALGALAFAQAPATAPRLIYADLNHVRGPHSKVFRRCIGAGRANEGLRADWQRQLAMVQRDIGFEYIRMHGLLHDDMGVYREDAKGNPIYNFQYIDQLYDALLRLHIKPFVELGFMPSALASGKETVFWWNGNITPPKSYDKWAGLITALVRHWEQRYGVDEVKTWYFEVWNEPDLKGGFYTGTLDEYLKFYRVTAEAIKKINAAYRVGGPASAIPYQFEEALVAFCAREKVPIDFVSTHSYGVKEGFFDDTGNRGTILDSDPGAVRDRMVHSRELIRKSPLPNLELHFTEWSSAYTPTDPIHDQYHQAAFILDKIKGAQESVDSMSYWTFTDIFEEGGPRMTPFHGGFGLLNYQSIKKPAYYAFQFLSRLGETEIENTDKSSWVCTNRNGDIQVLLWDFTPIAPPDNLNDQVYYKRDLPPEPRPPVTVVFDNVAPGTYLEQTYQIGYRHNDAYAAYLDLGSPAQLTKAQVEAISAVAGGEPSVSRVITLSGGHYRFELHPNLAANEVCLVVLRKL
jgi:xylan 1,4-beta-xylosidase